MKELKALTSENIKYEYFKCKNCEEEVLDKNQLHSLANKYNKLS